ncbi:MAG: S8/S53 family peptidase [Actinomycetota bacterium]
MRRGLLVAVMLLAVVGPALSAEPVAPPQTRALNGAFLEYLPPPPRPGVVCVVDRGVPLTPDTEPLIDARVAADAGGSLGDAADEHGSFVVGVLGAPRNGWGGVGLWPRARVVSVAVSAAATGEDLARAVVRCLLSQPLVVSLSLSDDTGSAALASAVELARDQGVSVVVAAGNTGGDLVAPANLPGVLAVSASDPGTGRLCPFSARSPVALSAPGCGVLVAGADGAVAARSGTSLAAPQASALLAALRAYAPQLDAASAEAILRQTARTVTAGEPPVLDAAAAFRAAGLSALVDISSERVHALGNLSWQVSPRAPRPRVITWRRTGGTIIVRLSASPRGRVVWGGPGPVTRLDRAAIRVGLRARPRRIWLVATGPDLRPSPRYWLTVPALLRTLAPEGVS